MATDAYTIWAIKGQPFSFTVAVKDFTDSNLFTGGLTGLTCAIAKDEATSLTAISGTATEIGTTGLVRVALDATDMEADVIAGQVSCSDANAVYALFEIKTIDTAEPGERVLDADYVRWEDILTQLWRRWHNRLSLNRDTGVVDLYNDADSASELSGTATYGATSTSQGKLS